MCTSWSQNLHTRHFVSVCGTVFSHILARLQSNVATGISPFLIGILLAIMPGDSMLTWEDRINTSGYIEAFCIYDQAHICSLYSFNVVLD